MIPIHIYFTKFTQELPDQLLNYYLDLLPKNQKERNYRFVRWQDRHSHLFGKLLLIEGLELLGYDQKELLNLKYNQYLRPYINTKLDFNISHSGEFVICAIGENIRAGVDIEEIKKVDFNDFRKTMSDKQWEDIYHSTNPDKSFFKYWTMKESFVKADSRGLNIPLQDIHIENYSVTFEDQVWFLNEMIIDENYCSHLTTNQQDVHIIIKEVDFSNGILRDRIA